MRLWSCLFAVFLVAAGAMYGLGVEVKPKTAPPMPAAPKPADPTKPADPPKPAADKPISFDADIHPLIVKYCFGCHNPEKLKGDVDLTIFKTSAIALNRDIAGDVWYHVSNRVELKEMPPEGRPWPTDDERTRIIDWVEKSVGKEPVDCETIATDKNQKFYQGHVMSRRLTRFEYDNTIRDLIGLDLHLSNILPEDGSGGEGFNTSGDSLFLSAILIEKYLQAADQALDAVLPSQQHALADLSLPVEAARRRLLLATPDEKISAHDAAKTDLAAFARRAFRRPVGDDEVVRLLSLFDRAQARGDSFEASLRLALKGVLISPHFLFLVEPEPPKEGIYRLGDYPLASRLSYFLWSSMPDEELMKLADQRRLGETDVLRQQVRRMVKDPRSKALGENFAAQWLGITALGGASRPDPKRFPEFDDDLSAAMHDEAVEFVGYVLRNDRGLMELLDADYTFLNERLAKHYGIAGVSGPEMRKVQLADRTQRGGLLGLGAILTSTSYPLRTSPVLRGKWVLEEILGDGVPPPPPTAGKLPQDDNQSDGLTMRQRLERHRSQAECAGCHRKMDPLGFGLENFDAIGRWRTEQGGKPVDATGELPSGEKFAGPLELREMLVKRHDEFLRNFTRKMLGYALGRGLGKFDNCVVDSAVKNLDADHQRASILLDEIVLSLPFRYRYSKK